MTLALDEFLRRFLLHVLPRGFVRIRNFGFPANRRRASLLPTASNCYAAPLSKPHQHRPARHLRIVPTGVDHCAAEPCLSSNESPQHNCCSVLRRRLSNGQHEPPFPISSLSR